jgi:hypothetical protein
MLTCGGCDTTTTIWEGGTAMRNPIYKERIPEWMNSVGMLLASIQLLWLTETWDEVDGYLIFEYLGVPKIVPIVFLGIIGVLRVIALYINGSWKRTPFIRAVGAISGAIFFTLLFLGGFLPAIVFAVADVYSGYKVGYDAGKLTTK